MSVSVFWSCVKWDESPYDETNKMARAPSEDSDQPGHPPSLIQVFAASMKTAWVFSYALSAQRRLWSDWVDAQAELSLRWVHSLFVGFVMRRLRCEWKMWFGTVLPDTFLPTRFLWFCYITSWKYCQLVYVHVVDFCNDCLTFQCLSIFFFIFSEIGDLHQEFYIIHFLDLVSMLTHTNCRKKKDFL